MSRPRLVPGAKFSTKMRMFGVPYRITSTVTAIRPDELIEWRHPVGHRWRWEFTALTPTLTRVTETFDYRDAGPIKDKLRYYLADGLRQKQRGRYRGNTDQVVRALQDLSY